MSSFWQKVTVFEKNLFYFINHLPHNRIFDSVALFFSGVGTYGLIWIGLAALLLLREERKDKWYFFPLILATVSSLILVEWFLKSIFARPRPDLSLADTIIVGFKLNSYSFPSGHAAAAFAGAKILAFEEKRLRYFFYIFAILIAVSRIYLGKHFVSDVIIGSLLGYLTAYVVVKIFKKSFIKKK